MKFLIFIAGLLSSALSLACPTISGTYDCVQSDRQHVISIESVQDKYEGFDRYVIRDGVNLGGKMTFTSCKGNTLRNELADGGLRVIIELVARDKKQLNYSIRTYRQGKIAQTLDYVCKLVGNEETIANAKTMLRQIADLKHFGRDGLKSVLAALEGPKGSLSASVESIACEPSLGSKDCVIHLKVTDASAPNGFQDLSFDIEVKIFQGKVISGGPVKVEE